MHINVNNTTLYFDVAGSEISVDRERLRARPTLVVLPGGPGFDHGYLRPGLAELVADAQVVFVDLRGQGRSSPAPAESCSLEQMADDVAALCRALGIPRPVIFGHSAGGFVALHLALRHPRLPVGLILCHTTPTLAPLPDAHPPAGVSQRAGAEAAAVAARLFGGDFSRTTGEAFARLVFPYYAAPGQEHIPNQLMALSSMNTDVAAHFFAEIAPGYDLRPRLGDIAAPTLVIVGRHDWVCPPAGGRAMASAIPAAQLVELPNAGHFGFSETPQPFLAAVRGHLADIETSRPSAPAVRQPRAA